MPKRRPPQPASTNSYTEIMHTQTETETSDRPIPGLTMLLRISANQHSPGIFTPPEAILEEYYQFAQQHGGKVLYPFTRNYKTLMPAIDSLGLFASDTKALLYGTVTGFGGPYAPGSWDALNEYQAPQSVRDEPTRHWVALDNVATGTLDPSLYSAINKTAGTFMPLDQLFSSKTRMETRKGGETYTMFRAPMTLICPQGEEKWALDKLDSAPRTRK